MKYILVQLVILGARKREVNVGSSYPLDLVTRLGLAGDRVILVAQTWSTIRMVKQSATIKATTMTLPPVLPLGSSVWRKT